MEVVGQIVAVVDDVCLMNGEDWISAGVGHARNVAMPINWDQARSLKTGLTDYFTSSLGIGWLCAPSRQPETIVFCVEAHPFERQFKTPPKIV
jgi:hypothetical protein